MSENNHSYNNEEDKKKQKRKSICSVYMITHIIISFFAIYLSWKCNNGFNPLAFLAALCCPYLYIIWALATNGGCGIFDNSQQSLVSSNQMSSSPFLPSNQMSSSPFLPSNQMSSSPFLSSNQMTSSPFLSSNQMTSSPFLPSNQMSYNLYSPTSSMSPIRQIRF